MSDGVGKDDEVLSGVEYLTGPEEDVRKLRREKLRTRTSGAVHDQHSVACDSAVVFRRCTDGQIMKFQFGKSLT